MTIQDVESTGNARAGLAGFGGEVTLHGGLFTCDAFDVNGETSPSSGAPASFGDHPDWRCSKRKPAECTELAPCKIEHSGIQPPPALPEVDPLPP